MAQMVLNEQTIRKLIERRGQIQCGVYYYELLNDRAGMQVRRSCDTEYLPLTLPHNLTSMSLAQFEAFVDTIEDGLWPGKRADREAHAGYRSFSHWGLIAA